MQQVRHIGVAIATPLSVAYAFASQPRNFARWAAGMATKLHDTPDGWVAETPEGQAEIEFSSPNDYGILDHHVRLPAKPDIYIPLRMIANGDGTEVILTLIRQPGMDDAAFEHDAAAVQKDLHALKALLEG